MHRASLQARLLVLLSLLLAILWAALGLVAERDAAAQAARELERRLDATAGLLRTVARAGVGEGALREIVDAGAAPDTAFARPAYELRREGRTLIRSTPFPVLDDPPPPGLATVAGEGGRWIVLTAIEGDTIRRAALPEAARDDRAAELRGALSAPWSLALPVFAIAALAAIWLGLRPLREIERRMRAVDPGAPVPIALDTRRLPRELATLASGFDDLVARLARVLSDRRIFASVASHELRTPLSGALIQLDVLDRAPERAAPRARIREALSHMDRLVSQLLFLARGDGAVAEAGPVAFDLAALAAEIAAEPPGGVTLDAPPAPVPMTGHPDLVAVLMRNLLRNARAAAGSEEVRLAVTGEDGTARIAVLDRGPGVPPAERAAMFDPFRRGTGGAGGPGGTGLGLTVARRVAEIHGGRIEIADRPGGGAAVSATLRRTPPGAD